MCEVCRSSPCLSGCPNAPDPEAIHTCKHCGEDIVVGDEYYEYDGEYYHEECFEDCAVALLMEAGAKRSTASEDDIDDGSDYLYESRRDEMLLERCG